MSQIETALDDSLVREIVETVAPFTMVHETGVAFSIEQAISVTQADIPGAIVECGVWKGGCSIAMLLAQRAVFGEVKKPVHLLDSFQGLPPVDDRDGPLAKSWQNGADPDKFFDNCSAPRAELDATLEKLGFSEKDFTIWEGWFEDTVPQLRASLEGESIALLRLDSDWYESTELCLNLLMPITSEEAPVILDDYYAWDGCAQAVHDFLARERASYRIKSLPYNFGAYFIKRANRQNFEQF